MKTNWSFVLMFIIMISIVSDGLATDLNTIRDEAKKKYEQFQATIKDITISYESKSTVLSTGQEVTTESTNIQKGERARSESKSVMKLNIPQTKRGMFEIQLTRPSTIPIQTSSLSIYDGENTWTWISGDYGNGTYGKPTSQFIIKGEHQFSRPEKWFDMPPFSFSTAKIVSEEKIGDRDCYLIENPMEEIEEVTAKGIYTDKSGKYLQSQEYYLFDNIHDLSLLRKILEESGGLRKIKFNDTELMKISGPKLIFNPSILPPDQDLRLFRLWVESQFWAESQFSMWKLKKKYNIGLLPENVVKPNDLQEACSSFLTRILVSILSKTDSVRLYLSPPISSNLGKEEDDSKLMEKLKVIMSKNKQEYYQIIIEAPIRKGKTLFEVEKGLESRWGVDLPVIEDASYFWNDNETLQDIIRQFVMEFSEIWQSESSEKLNVSICAEEKLKGPITKVFGGYDRRIYRIAKRLWVDKKTLLPVKLEFSLPHGGGSGSMLWSDFRKVNEVYEMPYKCEVSLSAGQITSTVVKSVVVNSGLSDELFDSSRVMY